MKLEQVTLFVLQVKRCHANNPQWLAFLTSTWRKAPRQVKKNVHEQVREIWSPTERDC